jgi:myosin-crossreactive antigen
MKFVLYFWFENCVLMQLQQQVDDSASDQDSRAKRLKERRHATAAAAALEIRREDTMTMTTTTTTKSATFKDILASERSSSENSGDESLSPGSTRVAGNKNKKNKQQHGAPHPSTMKNKVKVLQQQPPCSEPTTSCKQDYVHVRARRGQATDSHSLAERVRVPNAFFTLGPQLYYFSFGTSNIYRGNTLQDSL